MVSQRDQMALSQNGSNGQWWFQRWQAWRTYKAALGASFVPSHHPPHPLYYACLHPSSVQSFDTNLCHSYPTGSCSANDAASLPTSCAVYVLSIYQATSLSLSTLQLHRNLQSRAIDVRDIYLLSNGVSPISRTNRPPLHVRENNASASTVPHTTMNQS
jgi:hypothetical protein